jgi:hypothetical protein
MTRHAQKFRGPLRPPLRTPRPLAAAAAGGRDPREVFREVAHLPMGAAIVYQLTLLEPPKDWRAGA